MGQVSSQVRPSAAYNTDPRRFCVQRCDVYLNEGDMIAAGPECVPASNTVVIATKFDQASQQLVAYKPDQRPLSFVQDPSTGVMMLQVPYQPSLSLRFSLTYATTPGRGSPALGFAHAGSAKELEQIVLKKQTENWVRVGEFVETDTSEVHRVEFLWVWDAQADRIGGWPLHFAFLEERDGRPNLLSGAALWISERPRAGLFFSEFTMSPGGTMAPNTALPPSAVQSTPLHPHQSAPALATGLPMPTTPGPPLTTTTTSTSSTEIGSPTQKLQAAYGLPLGTDPLIFKAPRPTQEHMAHSEDGPQFRSALAAMERRIPPLKARVKQLLKRTLMSRERLLAVIEADQWLASGITEAARMEMTAFKPVMDWFSRSSEGGLSAIQRQRKATLNELSTRIIEPLQQFYEFDIKGFEARKRDFEEDSSQFYSWTSRYLAARRRGEHADAHADQKFALRKKSFDAARLAYFSYLTDITSGLKQQVLLQLLALAAQTITDSHIALGSEMASHTRPRIDNVVDDIKIAARQWEKHRIDSLQRRRTLANDVAQQVSEQTEPEPDQQEPRQRGRYKEGLLWASSRPGGVQDSQGTNKQSLQNLKWHKYWVVQDGGSISEYTNWKQSVDLHNEPINLLMASVREATTTDRRFCFEVVTPQYKRVYQATSEEDMRSWIQSISQGISTRLEVGNEHPESPRQNLSLVRKVSRTGTSGGNLKPRVAPITTTFPASTPINAPVSAPIPTPMSPTIQQKPTDLFLQVHRIPSNQQCAECQTTAGVEWVSINLLQVLCIECGGAHRSLGAHISKVRSLTLDTVSFTPSLCGAILAVSNEKMNQIWEAKAQLALAAKPAPTATSATRLKFVSEKYVEKQFIDEIEKPNSVLRKAIAERDIAKMCAALAARANPSGVSDDNEPMVIHALRSTPPTETAFPAAEVLIVNGAAVPLPGEYKGLTKAAHDYLVRKQRL